MLSAQVAVSHRFDLGGGDTAEVMADPNNQVVAQSSGSHSRMIPELRVAYTAPISDSWSIRPYVGGSLRQYLSDPMVDVAAGFAWSWRWSFGGGAFHKEMTSLPLSSTPNADCNAMAA